MAHEAFDTDIAMQPEVCVVGPSGWQALVGRPLWLAGWARAESLDPICSTQHAALS